MLVIDVTLIELPTRAPADVKAPPARCQADFERTRIHGPDARDRHTPSQKFDQVTVHYTGWTTDGKMFDSSVARGKPATLPLDRVIPGWTEGLQLMVAGEKVRFWIPQNLAYQGKQPPFGMLVFDIELISIQ